MIDWVVIVPIKRFAEGKSRLDVPDRAAVAEALARDTLDAVAACERVVMILVITDDPHLADDLSLPVAAVVRVQVEPGLNAAVSEALAYADASWPALGQAVLLGDLPSLTPDDLAEALRTAEDHQLGVVPDSTGRGTAMITALPEVPLLPAFGIGSAARYVELGHRPLRAPERLRRDVDVVADLDAALQLGVGLHTAAVLRSLSAAS